MDFELAVSKLERYGLARDRNTDSEPRQVILSDNEAVSLLNALEDESKLMGRADWIWDAELQTHIPCCIQLTKRVGIFADTIRKCGNGPLTGDAVITGNCGEKHIPHL